LPKRLFDYRNKLHVKKLAAILPDNLTIQGNYGWSAFGSQEYTKEELLDYIQGKQVPFTGITDEAGSIIKKGVHGSRYKRDGGVEVVIKYDRNTDTVEYMPAYAYDGLASLRSNIEWYEKEDPTNFRKSEMKSELKQKEEKQKTFFLKLNPPKRSGYDNWEVLESKELRPYLKRLGFFGALMQENKHETACVFDAHNIRLASAKFEPSNRMNTQLLANNQQK
jgi:hypothetical protein